MWNMVTESRTQVLATVRAPDGHSGEIDGLVIAQRHAQGGWEIIDKPTAVRFAARNLLWCAPPGVGGKHAEIEAVDGDRDGYYDFVRTVPDYTQKNNLLALTIFDRVRRKWVDARGYDAPEPQPS